MDKVHLCVVMGKHTEMLVLDVADISEDNLILGVNWLCRHNLTINRTPAGQHPLVVVRSKWHGKLKKARTRKTRFLCDQKKEVVEVARACINDAINHTKEGSAFLEQQVGPGVGAGRCRSTVVAKGSAGRSGVELCTGAGEGGIDIDEGKAGVRYGASRVPQVPGCV
ncbi:hypothetical protein C0993_004129 [Termitomyces sp. T159_Od127]|nr:hypothetical protein C0993_004129 [Termitomyces sp. T159_Od127]